KEAGETLSRPTRRLAERPHARESEPGGSRFSGGAACDPESAFVRKLPHRSIFPREFAPQVILDVTPTGGGEIGQDFIPIRQMHKSVATFVAEAAVAKFPQTRVLRSLGPAFGFLSPIGALGRRVVAIVRGEQKRGVGAADGRELPQRPPAVAAQRDLHEPVKHKQTSVET